MIIEVPITDIMIRNAQEKSIDQGVLRLSFEKGTKNFIGYIGEEIVKSYLQCDSCNTYEYDMVYNGKRIEVKSKQRSVPPQPHYECSIVSYSVKNQHPDYYVFTSISQLSGIWKGWILGYCSQSYYMNMAVFLKKGQLDPSNGYTVRNDCYNVPISELYDINLLI